MPNALSLAFDNAILRSREALAVADQIEQAPVRVKALRIELAALSSEIISLRTALSSEKSAWQSEWTRMQALREQSAGNLAQEEAAHTAELDAAKATLVAIQNRIGAVRLRVEKIAELFRKLDRMLANPSSGAPGMPALLAEIEEAVK